MHSTAHEISQVGTPFHHCDDDGSDDDETDNETSDDNESESLLSEVFDFRGFRAR